MRFSRVEKLIAGLDDGDGKARAQLRQFLREHGRRDAAADDADIRFVASCISVGSRSEPAKAAALVASDGGAVAEIVGVAATEVEGHQVGGDVAAVGSLRERR